MPFDELGNCPPLKGCFSILFRGLFFEKTIKPPRETAGFRKKGNKNKTENNRLNRTGSQPLDRLLEGLAVRWCITSTTSLPSSMREQVSPGVEPQRAYPFRAILKPWQTIVCRYLQGKASFQWFLRWCRIPSIHSMNTVHRKAAHVCNVHPFWGLGSSCEDPPTVCIFPDGEYFLITFAT